jgi:hypothetical protein
VAADRKMPNTTVAVSLEFNDFEASGGFQKHFYWADEVEMSKSVSNTSIETVMSE